MSNQTKINRALISVFDKTGVVSFAQALHQLGIEIVSTGSTAQHIIAAGVPVTAVESVTGFPEMMNGRVKTLHPSIHGGILAKRDVVEHMEAMATHGISPIDLVVVNLYPFADTIANPATTAEEAIEMIDIGGPTMVRAAAKNFAHVGIVVDSADYDKVVETLQEHGELSAKYRRALATKAFAHTAEYDAAVAAWFTDGFDTADDTTSNVGTNGDAVSHGALANTDSTTKTVEALFPTKLDLSYTRSAILRYGENPHQQAAFYLAKDPWGLGSVTIHNGKELSYNNLVDTNAALAMAMDFDEPCVAIIKHTNPAGLAIADTIAQAYAKALEGDPVSAFGGVVAANRPIDFETAEQIVAIFTEVLIAPGITPDALALLRTKKNLRILTSDNLVQPAHDLTYTSIAGGFLVQEDDQVKPELADWKVVTTTKPNAETMAELEFAWKVCKHVKSNAIVLAKGNAVVGVGAGQMSRVDSVRIAIEKSGTRHTGSVLASDAFFPFADGVELALAAGVKAIVSPGGSVRDEEVIKACDEASVPMVFTGRRHFRH